VSAIASFTKLPKSSIEALRAAAIPKKRLFGSPKDVYWDFVREHGVEVAKYRWSGYVMAAVIPYLTEKHGINLSSELSDLGSFLSEQRRSSFFPLTLKDKEMYLQQLGQEFPESELRDYYNKLFEADDSGVGAAMKDGILAIKQALGAVDGDSFVLLHIG
jgi:hypothetical protein